MTTVNKEGIELSNVVMGKRARSSRFSSGDYHFEQDDLDLSDSDDGGGMGAAKKTYVRGPYNKGASGGRTKECPQCGAKIGISVKECVHCDHLFTSKSSLVTGLSAEAESQNIRDKFPFEPEREDDGSLKIQGIIGRRLRKEGARDYLNASVFANLSATDTKYDHEYLIKYKGVSYRGVQWLTALDIDAGKVSGKQMLSRYLTKLDRSDPSALEDGEIDPTFLEIERILDVREEDVMEIQDETSTARAAEEADKAATAAVEEKKAVEAASGGATGGDAAPLSSFPSKASFAESTSSKNTKDDDDANSVASDATADSDVALTKMQIFNHVERCRRVLQKVWDDPLAAGFVEPVDTELYDDYLDSVEEPICLQDIRERLDEGWYRKSGKHTSFVQDLRLIWKNCKSYNLYKSQIWHSAHVLAMLTERLYQAWVLSFKDATVGIDEPIGQPWEETCRVCDSHENEEQVILCDHCDASYHIYCLVPPLQSIPEGTWVCDRCTRWLEADVGRKLLTATQEDEARVLTQNATEKVVVKVRKKKYLVKWRGLSYRDCTWELPKDIDDDSKIAEFHGLNENAPDEPPLTQEELDMELRKDRAKPLPLAILPDFWNNHVFDVDAEIYAQIRSYHFLKWNLAPPAALLRDSGALLNAYTNGYRSSMLLKRNVADSLLAIENGDRDAALKVPAEADGFSYWSSSGKFVAAPSTEPEAPANAAPVEVASPPANESVEDKRSREKREKEEKKKVEKERKRKEKEDEKKRRKEAEEEEKRLPLKGIATPTIPPGDPARGEVAALMGDVLLSVVRGVSNAKNGTWYSSSESPTETRHLQFSLHPYPSRPKLAPSTRVPGELEVCIPNKLSRLGQEGGRLGLRIANYYGRPAVSGFLREGHQGRARICPAEMHLKAGDIITGVNGLDVRRLTFHVVLSLIVNSKANYLYLRVLRTLDRGGEAGKKDRAVARSQKLGRLAAEKAERAAKGIRGDEADEEVVPEDDPEQDPVQRYVNRFGEAAAESVRLAATRSLYQGVFPTAQTTCNSAELPQSWTASYWVYAERASLTEAWRRSGKTREQGLSEARSGMWDAMPRAAAATSYGGAARGNPAKARECLAMTDLLLRYCVTLPPCGTETEAALARDRAMRSTHHYPQGATKTGADLTVTVDTATMNFVEAQSGSTAESNLTTNARILSARVREERRDAAKKAEYLQTLSDRVVGQTPAVSSKKEKVGQALSTTAPSSASEKVSPVKMEISAETSAAADAADAAAGSGNGHSAAKGKSEGKAKGKSKKMERNVIDEMDDEEDEEYDDEDDEEEEDDDDDDDDMSLGGEEEEVAKRVKEEDSEDEGENKSVHSLALSYDSMDSDTDVAPPAIDDSSEEDSDGSSDGEWEEDENGEWKPAKQVEEQSRPDGPTVRLYRATNEASMPPLAKDWNRYILELASGTKVAETRKISDDAQYKGQAVDQIDGKNGATVRTWSSVAAAAHHCSVAPKDISDCIFFRRDTAGGFKWKISTDSQALEVAEAMELLEEGTQETSMLDKATEGSNWRQKLYKTTKTYKTGGTLRDYQLDGLNWLLRCWYQKRSSILADEMGLGKTVQVVTTLDHMYEVEHIRGPFLVCVPLSTISHWQREFEGWSNMTVCVYHDTQGGRDMRDIIREFQWYYKGRSRRLLKFHTLITTYDDLIRDYEELADIPWRICVVDEAHRLRNVNSKLLDNMRTVLKKGMDSYGYQHRILLTGTPLQNNTAELWSLLNFIEPAKFPDAEKFSSRFGSIRSSEQVEALQKRIAPHLLRRVKEDVAKDIPPKEETIIDVELTTMQKQYYRAIYEHNHGFLMQNLKGSMPKLMNIQMELRKCCNHPFLVQGVEDTEMDGVDEKMMKGRANSMSSDEGAEAPVARGAASGARLTAEARERNLKRDKEYKRLRMETSFIPSSGKMVLLDKLLPKLQKEGHKVLIFSQMVRMIDYIEEYCNFREYPCERLDGRVSGNDRQKSIDRFNKEENSFVFLLSTRAGGVGINLTAADTCIIFDSDWNPQNDVQAMARCHRIGQKKQVTIYRLITRKSFEAEMFDRASRKLGLEQAVLGTRQFDAIEMDEAREKKDKVDTKEMEQLLREGAYAVLMEEDDGEAEDFLANDIDQILQKRSHTTVTEAGPTTESWLNKKKKRGRTKKSVFKGQDDGDAAEIDVNDPDFWKKVLPDLVTPESMQEAYQTQFEGATEPAKQGEIKKYFKDLSQMMKGLLDLNSRGTLPDKEKEVCMNLLLLISINESMFSEKDRVQANTWLAAIEGSRSRKQRIDLSSPAKKSKKKGDGDSAALGGGGRKSRSNGNVIYKDEGEDSDVELDMYGLAIPKKRKRMSKKEKAAKAAAGDTGEDYLDDPELLDDDEAFVYAAEDDDEAYGGKGTGKGRGRPKGALDKKQRKRKGEGQPRKKKKSKKQLEEEQAHGADLDDDDSLNDVTAAALKRNRAVPKRKSAESVHFDDGGATDSDDDIFGGGPRPPPAKKANKTERAMHSKKVREVLKGHFSGQATAEPDYDEDDSDDPYSMN